MTQAPMVPTYVSEDRIQTVYAVRVKGTQKYLPRPQRADGRGGSHLEPMDFADRSTMPAGFERNMMIRTFTTEGAAKNLLASWLQGAVHCDRGREWSHGGECYEYYEENRLERKPERRAEDMEIVKIHMILPN